MSTLGAAPTITSVAAPTMIGLAAAFITVVGWWGGIPWPRRRANCLWWPAYPLSCLVLSCSALLPSAGSRRQRPAIMPLNAIYYCACRSTTPGFGR